ncbi:MAG: DNA-binding domain-containing protein, partial [Lactobacillus sp.]|nr:DNA-binding domain-containing protein [Lactobacillus sp.]
GITSEAGSADILLISKLMNEQNLRFNELNFNDIYQINDREKKVLLQRIRRAVKTGLINLANMFLDGLDDEISLEYANALYEYKNVRHEIDYLQGKRTVGGKISLKHFFDGLIQEI